MLYTQKQFLSYLKDVQLSLDATSLVNDDLKKLSQDIKSTELIVPIIGAFSAGKSTLINSFLNSNILPTNITPETALATELRYSENDYIEAITKNNTVKKFELSEIETVKNNADQYKYLKLYLNNPQLKEIEPLILVDMPGFDSPLELHNQAILMYLNKGVHFIVLTSIEDGTISKSMLRELHNIEKFGKEFTFCLSKTNLRAPEDVLDVSENIQDQLEIELDYEEKIVLLDDNSGENLSKILSAIDIEDLFKSLFIDRLKSNYFELDSTINTTISTLKNTTQEAQEAILSLQENVSKISKKKEEMVEDISAKYSSSNVEAITSSVANEILLNQEMLVNLALKNQTAFSNELNNIVKTKLISEITTKMDNVSSDIVENFRIELSTLQLSDFKIDESWVQEIADSTKTLLNKGVEGMNSLAENLSKKEKKGSGYKVLSTIFGITTNVINPALELIIVFLPEIISFFTASSKEKKLKDEVLLKLSSEIIPTLKLKLRETLIVVFQEQVTQLILQISQEFEDKLKQKELEISQAVEEKKANIEDTNLQIEKLEEVKKTLLSNANSAIFKG